MPEFPRCRNKSLKLAQSSGHNIILTSLRTDPEAPLSATAADINRSNLNLNYNAHAVDRSRSVTKFTRTRTPSSSSLSEPVLSFKIAGLKADENPTNKNNTSNLKNNSCKTSKGNKGNNNNLNRMNRVYKILSIVFKAINYGRGESNPEGLDDLSGSGRRSEMGMMGRSRSVSESRRSRPPSAPSTRKPPVIRIRRERSLNGVMWGSPQQVTSNTSDSANTTFELPPNMHLNVLGAPDIDLEGGPERRSRKRQKQRRNNSHSTSDGYLNNILDDGPTDQPPPPHVVTSQYRQYFRPSPATLEQSVSHVDLHSHSGNGNHLKVDEASRYPSPRSKSQSQSQSQLHYPSGPGPAAEQLQYYNQDPNQHRLSDKHYNHYQNMNMNSISHQNLDHQSLYSPEAERFVRAAIDKSQPSLPSHQQQQQQQQQQQHLQNSIILTPQPVERQIIRIINGNDPTVQSQVLLNTKTTQPWEDLVRDLGMAVKLPKKKGSLMETISGRSIQSYSQLRSELQVGNQAFYIFPHREDFAELGLPSLSLTQHNANARSRRNGQQENNPNLISLQNSIQNPNLPLLHHHQQQQDAHSNANLHNNNNNNNMNVVNRNNTNKKGKPKTGGGASGGGSMSSLSSHHYHHPDHGPIAGVHGPVISRSNSHTTPLNLIQSNSNMMGAIPHHPQQQQAQQPPLGTKPNKSNLPTTLRNRNQNRKSAKTVHGSADFDSSNSNSTNHYVVMNNDNNNPYLHNQVITNHNHAEPTHNLLPPTGHPATMVMANQIYTNLPMSSRSNPNLSLSANNAPRSPSLQGSQRQLSSHQQQQPAQAQTQQGQAPGSGAPPTTATLQVPNRKRSTRRRRSEASVYLASARSRSRSISP